MREDSHKVNYVLNSLGPPAAKKVHFFLAFPSTFLVKLGGFSFFVLTYVSLKSPLRAEYFVWHTYRPCPMIPSRRNMDACILHACDVSFTIANYKVMGTSSATDKCTKNSQLAMGVSAIYGFVEKYETLPILPFIY